MVSLLDLPSELLQNILSSIAAKEPPSKENLHEEPSLFWLTSTDTSLKNIHQTCWALRDLSSDLLFSCLKSKVGDIPSLISFAREYGLRGHVHSLVLYAADLAEVDRSL